MFPETYLHSGFDTATYLNDGFRGHTVSSNFENCVHDKLSIYENCASYLCYCLCCFQQHENKKVLNVTDNTTESIDLPYNTQNCNNNLKLVNIKKFEDEFHVASVSPSAMKTRRQNGWDNIAFLSDDACSNERKLGVG